MTPHRGNHQVIIKMFHLRQDRPHDCHQHLLLHTPIATGPFVDLALPLDLGLA